MDEPPTLLPPIRTLHRERLQQEASLPLRRRSMSSYYSLRELEDQPEPSPRRTSFSESGPLTPTSLEEFRRALKKKHYLSTLSAAELAEQVDQADAKVFGVDDACRVNLWNARMAQFARRPATEVMYRPLHEALAGLTEEESFFGRVYAALDGAEVTGQRCRLRSPAGEERQQLLSVAARRDPEGGVAGAACVLQDCEAKRSNILADVEAQHLLDTLAALATALEKEREQAALRAEAERMADAVLETKVTYVRRLSHEVRTPLQVILSGLQLILQHRAAEVSAGVREVLEEVRQACLDSIGILDDLLAYERLDNGSMTLDTEPVALSDLVRRCVRGFEGSARLAEVALETLDDSTGKAMVGADRHKLAQVLRNMLSSALKFSPRDGKITVQVTSQGKCARVAVRDGGPGLTAEMLRRLMEDSSRHDHRLLLEDEQGYGMGLWLSRGIVELHGGRMGVESEGLGKGCTFFLEMPLLVETESSSAESTQIATSPAPSMTPHLPLSVRHQSNRFTFSTSSDEEDPHFETPQKESPSQPLKILVVDDSLLCRKMVVRVLRDEGLVHEAVDGRDATALVLRSMQEQSPYHIIIMDSAMPHTTGPAATEELRRRGYKGVVLGLTGNALPADVDNFLCKGADAVLLKPLDIQVLKRHVEETRRRNSPYSETNGKAVSHS